MKSETVFWVKRKVRANKPVSKLKPISYMIVDVKMTKPKNSK